MKIHINKQLFTELVFFTLTLSVFALKTTIKLPSNTNQTAEDGKYLVPDGHSHKAYVDISRTFAYGGNGGSDFEWSIANLPNFQAKKFNIRYGTVIDSIQIQFSNGRNTLISPDFGGRGGGSLQWEVPNSQSITQVVYRSGSLIDALTFITNKGNKSPRFGGGGGRQHKVKFPNGYRIVGFYGKAWDLIDQLGFILVKTIN